MRIWAAHVSTLQPTAATAAPDAAAAAAPRVYKGRRALRRSAQPISALGGGGDGQQSELQRRLHDDVAPHGPRQKGGVLRKKKQQPQ